MGVKKAESTRQILLVERKAVSLASTCIPSYNQHEGRLQEQSPCHITCAARRSERYGTSIYSNRNQLGGNRRTVSSRVWRAPRRCTPTWQTERKVGEGVEGASDD